MQGQNDSSGCKNGSDLLRLNAKVVCLFYWPQLCARNNLCTEKERNSPLYVPEQSSALASGKMLTKYFQRWAITRCQERGQG